jgi:hypothetical protein
VKTTKPAASKVSSRNPACPQGHDGHVVRNGPSKSRSSDGAFARQQYRCYPITGPSHDFTLDRRHPTADHPHGAICTSCEREMGPADGQRISRRFTQSVAEIAQVLVGVGRGDSLRGSAHDARHTARRFTLGSMPATTGTPRRRRVYASRQPVLAARYIDTFGEAVLADALPRRWPSSVSLDSKPLKIRPYGVVDWDDWTDMPGGALLTVAGREADERSSRAWRISLTADETADSWIPFLRSLDGEPEWVVADRASAIWKAVDVVWPNATRVMCSWHLKDNLIDAAKCDGVYHSGDQMLVDAIEDAFATVVGWEAVCALFARHKAAHALAWIATNDALVRRQATMFEANPTRPKSNGAAERFIKSVDNAIGNRRRNFRNAARFRTVLGLLNANLHGSADLFTYAKTVDALLSAPRQQPALVDQMDHGALLAGTSTAVPSMAALLLDAATVKANDLRAYNNAAKTRSVERIAETYNEARREQGLPPIVLQYSAGGIASVSVKGKLLTDFPEIACEWDGERNTRGPDGVPAGDGRLDPYWTCAAGHTWQAKVGHRVARLLRCQRCSTGRADPSTCLATVHPFLVPTFDTTKNGVFTPDTIKATYPKALWWTCDAGMGHPAYKRSIRYRLDNRVACGHCRRMKPPPGSLTTVAPDPFDLPF